MNRYGIRMRRHYAKHRVEELAALEDPAAYFETLGSQIETEIEELADQIAGPTRPEEGYLARMERLTEARVTAESEILAIHMAP